MSRFSPSPQQFVDRLPVDLSRTCFCFLSIDIVGSCLKVCRYWNRLICAGGCIQHLHLPYNPNFYVQFIQWITKAQPSATPLTPAVQAAQQQVQVQWWRGTRSLHFDKTMRYAFIECFPSVTETLSYRLPLDWTTLCLEQLVTTLPFVHSLRLPGILIPRLPTETSPSHHESQCSESAILNSLTRLKHLRELALNIFDPFSCPFLLHEFANVWSLHSLRSFRLEMDSSIRRINKDGEVDSLLRGIGELRQLQELHVQLHGNDLFYPKIGELDTTTAYEMVKGLTQLRSFHWMEVNPSPLVLQIILTLPCMAEFWFGHELTPAHFELLSSLPLRVVELKLDLTSDRYGKEAITDYLPATLSRLHPKVTHLRLNTPEGCITDEVLIALSQNGPRDLQKLMFSSGAWTTHGIWVLTSVAANLRMLCISYNDSSKLKEANIPHSPPLLAQFSRLYYLETDFCDLFLACVPVISQAWPELQAINLCGVYGPANFTLYILQTLLRLPKLRSVGDLLTDLLTDLPPKAQELVDDRSKMEYYQGEFWAHPLLAFISSTSKNELLNLIHPAP